MPQGLMSKYFSDRGGEDHGGTLFWPGTMEGFPFRGRAAPHLKQEEMEQIELVLDYKSRMFRLWEPAEKAGFDQIMDRIVNGWYMQHVRKDEWDPQYQHYRVWLEWIQIYGETARGKCPPTTTGKGSNGNSQNSTTVRPGSQPQGPPPSDLGLPALPGFPGLP